MSRILWNWRAAEDRTRQIVLDGKKLIEREKLPYGDTSSGRWMPEREISITEAGYMIAGARYRSESTGQLVIPGEIASELEAAVADAAPTYWGCYMTRAIHKLAGRKDAEIVNYAAVS